MIREFLKSKVVVDLRSTYVCLGTLTAVDDHFLELTDADFHDIRDTETTRENYIAESVYTGIKRNRKRVILFRDDVVAISLLQDVVDG